MYVLNVPVNRLCGPEWKGVACVSWLQTGAVASNALRSYYSKAVWIRKGSQDVMDIMSWDLVILLPYLYHSEVISLTCLGITAA